MKKRIRLILILALVLSLFLVGCTNQQSSKSNGEEISGEETLIFGRGADSYSLDPQNANEIETWKVSKNIYETLVEYDKETTEIIPKLAKEWSVSEDQKIWTFKLQEGVKFHDGTDFNAEAVVYNFERMMDKSFPDRYGDFSVYRGMFNGFKGEGSTLEEVKEVDEYTVQFTLVSPQATFLSNLSMHAFGIISPTAIKKYGEKINENAVGTGPFKFESWKPNDAITLVKNEDYWIPELPKLGKLIYKVIPDNSARLTALKNGEIDIMDGLNPSDLKSVQSDQNLQVTFRPALNVAYLSLNNTKKPFDNPKVRQAISHAINKQGLADAFYYGLAEPVKNMVPSTNWAYNNDIQDYEYDLDKAKSLLEEAGYPNGFDLEFSITSSSRIYMQQPTKMAEAIKTDLEKIGINVKIVSYEWASYFPLLNSGEHTMGLIGWVGDNGDPDNFIYSTLSKNNTVVGAAQNNSFYKNDEVNDLLIQAKTVLDQKQRTEMYKKVQQIAHDEAANIPLVQVEEPVVTAKYVKGYFPHPTGAENMYEVTIAK